MVTDPHGTGRVLTGLSRCSGSSRWSLDPGFDRRARVPRGRSSAARQPKERSMKSAMRSMARLASSVGKPVNPWMQSG